MKNKETSNFKVGDLVRIKDIPINHTDFKSIKKSEVIKANGDVLLGVILHSVGGGWTLDIDGTQLKLEDSDFENPTPEIKHFNNLITSNNLLVRTAPLDEGITLHTPCGKPIAIVVNSKYTLVIENMKRFNHSRDTIIDILHRFNENILPVNKLKDKTLEELTQIIEKDTFKLSKEDMPSITNLNIGEIYANLLRLAKKKGTTLEICLREYVECE